ncbi:MAG: DUF86 domain-containing protein [Chloroflexi bacterium]|nr:DUF86 domain-containing protein [Chloroflexota bacterium]
MQRDEVRLRHMLDAAEEAVSFMVDHTRSDLDTDKLLALAMVRLLEIIGEAAHAVTEETQQKNPQIPWRQIKGTRNRLIHGYYHVDMDIVWQIVRQDLPPLIANLEKMINS